MYVSYRDLSFSLMISQRSSHQDIVGTNIRCCRWYSCREKNSIRKQEFDFVKSKPNKTTMNLTRKNSKHHTS